MANQNNKMECFIFGSQNIHAQGVYRFSFWSGSISGLESCLFIDSSFKVKRALFPHNFRSSQILLLHIYLQDIIDSNYSINAPISNTITMVIKISAFEVEKLHLVCNTSQFKWYLLST